MKNIRIKTAKLNNIILIIFYYVFFIAANARVCGVASGVWLLRDS